MDREQIHHFKAEIWLYASTKAAWHFLTVPQDISHQIRFFAANPNGFGSVRVRVTIGKSHWSTSVFPDKASGCYFLPVKAEIRKKETIAAGDLVSVSLTTQ